MGTSKTCLMQGNFAPYNVGAVLWVNDLAIPLVILLLLFVRRRLSPSPAGTPGAGQ